jgi:hypothetical protein
LTGKAPYKFESVFLQRGVCKLSVSRALPRSNLFTQLVFGAWWVDAATGSLLRVGVLE